MLDIKNAESTLFKLVKAELPIKISFELSAIMDDIDVQLKKFEEFRVELVKKYGTETKNGLEVKGDNLAKFQTEMDELLKADVQIGNMVLPLDSLENTALSVLDIKALKTIGFLE